MGDYEINPKCIQRTAEALAEGHEIVQALELKVEEMRRERERELAELNKALALLTQNVLTMSATVKENTEDIGKLREIAMASRATLDILMDERNKAQEKANEARKPWVELVFGLLGKLAWVALGILGLALYDYIKKGGM